MRKVKWGVLLTLAVGVISSVGIISAGESPDSTGDAVSLASSTASQSIVINEFLANPWGVEPDNEWIELYNSGADAADLGGWFIGDASNPREYQIPEGSLLAPYGFMVFYGSVTGIRLNNNGDRIYLSFGNQIVDTVNYSATIEGNSSGRHPNGATGWVNMCSPTPGALNNDGTCQTTGSTSTTTTTDTTSTTATDSTTTTATTETTTTSTESTTTTDSKTTSTTDSTTTTGTTTSTDSTSTTATTTTDSTTSTTISTTTTLKEKTIQCGETITESVMMANDLTDCESGLIIGQDNITLDCAGHTIDGIFLYDGYSSGVLIDGQSAVVIRNCTLQEFDTGLNVHGSKGVLVVGDKFVNNYWRGILVDSSDYLNVVQNTFSGSIYAVEQLNHRPNETTSVTIGYNAFFNNSLSLYLPFFSTVELIGNNITCGAGGAGIFLRGIWLSSWLANGAVIWDVSGSTVSGNDIRNCNKGIEMTFGENVNLSENRLTAISYGILLSDSDNNMILNNEIAVDSLNAITLKGADGNVIAGNVIGDSKYGLKMTCSGENNITNNILNNVTYAVWLTNSAHNILAYNLFGAGGSSFVNSQAADTGALLNWWGTDNCSEIGELVVDNGDYPQFGIVDYSTILSNPETNETASCAPPTENISTLCGIALVEDTVLGADLTNCYPDGLDFGADNITLDCAGHSITALAEEWGAGLNGIRVDGRHGITIKNCTIYGFNTGVNVRNAGSITLMGNNISDNKVGIRAYGSNGIQLTQNRILNNKQAGIDISSSHDVATSYNLIHLNGNGVNFNDVWEITLSGNSISENHLGLNILYASGCVLSNNSIHRNVGGASYWSAECAISNNSIFNNSRFNIQTHTGELSSPYNWWGSVSCSKISVKIKGDVSFEPFLDAPYPLGRPVYCSTGSTTSSTTSTSSTSTTSSTSSTSTTLASPSGSSPNSSGGYASGSGVSAPKATCFDGILNRDEEQVDCGGVFCNPCTQPTTSTTPVRSTLKPEIMPESTTTSIPLTSTTLKNIVPTRAESATTTLHNSPNNTPTGYAVLGIATGGTAIITLAAIAMAAFAILKIKNMKK